MHLSCFSKENKLSLNTVHQNSNIIKLIQFVCFFSMVKVFNCSRSEAIIVNVCVFFMQNFRLTVLTFTLLTFCVQRDPKFSQSKFQAAEFNWRQFNTTHQMKSAPKLVPFFTFNLSGIF